MEEKFINRCKYSLDNLKEALSSRKTTMNVILRYVINILFIINIVLGFVKNNYAQGITWAIVWILVEYLLYHRLPNIRANKIYDQYKKVYNEEVQCEISFYEDNNIVSTNMADNNEVDINYNDIKEIVETDNLYLVILEGGLFHMLDKSEFIKGDIKDFIPFIKEKCSNVKLNLLKGFTE